MRLRLLPEDGELGWVPYAWLVYLTGFVAGMFWPPAPAWEWAVSVLGLGAFLGLYFRGYWVEGRQIVPIILGIAALGAVFMPLNWGGGGFFIYAAAFLGRAAAPGAAFRWLLVLAGFVTLEGWGLGLRLESWLFAPIFSLLIGGVNIHYAERERANVRLHRAQSEVEQLAKLAERERERIARDLHDLLGHTLSLIVLKSELASKLADRDPARAVQEIRDVEKISRQALAEVRAAVSGYRSRGLAAELEAVRAGLDAAGVELEARIEPGALEPLDEGVLALCLREGVTNVVRHAQARRCWVSLERTGAGLVLEVRDDGRGGAPREGSGLDGMRERLRELGGALTTDGSGGMRLRATLPARKEAGA